MLYKYDPVDLLLKLRNVILCRRYSDTIWGWGNFKLQNGSALDWKCRKRYIYLLSMQWCITFFNLP